MPDALDFEDLEYLHSLKFFLENGIDDYEEAQ